MIEWEPVDVPVAPGLTVTVLRARDPEHVLEAALSVGSDPYAAIVWPAAVVVAGELPGRVRVGERVLDLGAGTGLCALTAARLGARAHALDHDPAALAAVARAAALQGVRVHTSRFDLAGPEPLPPGELAILGDVLYEPGLARAAAARALEVLRRGGRIVVGDPARVGRGPFLEELAAAGFTAEFRERTVRVPGEAAESRVGVAWIRPGRAQRRGTEGTEGDAG